MVIEAARNLAGLPEANSLEFDEKTPDPVVATMADQVDVVSGERDMGGTMRLGLYPAELARRQRRGRGLRDRRTSTSATGTATRSTTPTGRALAEAGLVFSGTSPDGHLVEFVELPREVHPYYVGTQAHPEFRSRPTRGHPLFVGLIAAALARRTAG